MRWLGPVLVLLAVAAAQVPWFTCHSDCQNACGVLWVFEDHHCHDVDAGRCRHAHGHAHGKLHAHADRGDPAEDASPDGPQHDPGDHALYYHPVAQGQPPVSLDVPALAILAPPVPGLDVRLLAAQPARYSALSSVADPPADLANVRLLL